MTNTKMALGVLVAGATLCLVPGMSTGSIDDVISTPLAAAAQDPPAQTQGQRDQVQLVLNSNATTVKLAVPEFTVAGGEAELKDAAKTLSEVLWNDLDFEAEYTLVSREAAAKIPTASSIEALPFDKWAETGADAVLLGNVQRSAEGGLQVGIRIIAISGRNAKQQMFGNEYKNGGCAPKTARFCAHYISDDVHLANRRLIGVARTRLAFTSDRDQERLNARSTVVQRSGHELYMADYDGANQQRLTWNHSLNLGASWSPDGLSVSYSSEVAGYWDFYVHNIFEARAPSRPAAGNPGSQNWFGRWSPDGTKFAFQSQRTGDMDVWIMNRDGSGLVNLTHTPFAIDGTPSWAPSGNEIVFVSDRGSGTYGELYRIGIDGSNLEKLPVTCPCDAPTWSPLGNEIGYTTGPQGSHDIGLFNLATRKVTILTGGIGDNQSPTFAPNGRHLAFRTTRWGKQQIAVVDRTGNRVRSVIKGGNNEYPSWSPSPGGASASTAPRKQDGGL